MASEGKLSRRTALGWLGSVAAGLTVSGLLGGCAPRVEPGAEGATPALTGASDTDLEIVLRATFGEANILPGAATHVLRYLGELRSGAPGSLQEIPGSYLGPIIRARRGQRVRIHFVNEIDDHTIVHWHGLHVPDHSDGHPRLAIGPGESYDYDFTVVDRAGTYWYHPHPHGRTGPQVYGGLAGLLIVEDDEEKALGLPAGEREIPLVIQDRSFGQDNQLRYLGRGMMDAVLGFLGDRILVNGQADYHLRLSSEPHRLRILNGSNSRVYKLAWDDGAPLVVIGTDGGLLREPIEREYVALGPGERIDLWLDLSGAPLGTTRRLVSLPFDGEISGGMMGGQMGMMAEASLNQGARFDILRLQVVREGMRHETLPARLSDPPQLDLRQAANRLRPRRFDIEMNRMAWLLNGRSFEMEAVARNETVHLGDTEVWEFVNQASTMGMIHPIHVHNVQFKIVERQVASGYQAAWQSLSAGHLDEGWKDTVLLMPGERVKLLMRFDHYEGLYLYHCHNLEHEDSGMMRNYRIQA